MDIVANEKIPNLFYVRLHHSCALFFILLECEKTLKKQPIGSQINEARNQPLLDFELIYT